MKIRAAVTKKAGDPYEIMDVELMEPQANDVLVKMVACGLCRSDYGERNGNSIDFPNVLGHEGAGIVQRVGANVKSVKPGDAVILSYGYCASCKSCASGHPSGCDHWLDINNSGTNARGEHVLFNEEGPIHNFFNQSSFATYSVTDETNLVVVDQDVDLRLMGPLGCGLGTGSGAVFDVLKPAVGSSLAVFGTGAVGFAAIMAAKVCGCTDIVAIDINDQRLELAKELGATQIVNASNSDVAKTLQAQFPFGFDNTIDTTGVQSVMRDALALVRNNGTFVPLAVTKKNFELNTFFDLVFGNKRIRGVLIGDTIPKFHLPRLIELYKQGDFPFDRFVRFYDFDAINEAEQDSISGKVIKPVVIIDPDYQFVAHS